MSIGFAIHETPGSSTKGWPVITMQRRSGVEKRGPDQLEPDMPGITRSVSKM